MLDVRRLRLEPEAVKGKISRRQTSRLNGRSCRSGCLNLKIVAHDIRRMERGPTGLEGSVVVNYSRDGDKEDRASAHDFCWYAETSNNPGPPMVDFAPAGRLR